MSMYEESESSRGNMKSGVSLLTLEKSKMLMYNVKTGTNNLDEYLPSLEMACKAVIGRYSSIIRKDAVPAEWTTNLPPISLGESRIIFLVRNAQHVRPFYRWSTDGPHVERSLCHTCSTQFLRHPLTESIPDIGTGSRPRV